MKRFDSVCVLGGAGLVGYQVCRRLLREGLTDRLAVVSLWREETRRAVRALREEFPQARVQGRYGNVFARGELADSETQDKEPYFDRADRGRRRHLLADIYEDYEAARRESALVKLVFELEPSAVVDCINTATAISYQNVPSAARDLMGDFGLRGDVGEADHDRLQADVEALLVSIEIPQIILHVRLLRDALTAARTEVYVKVGTTGTGGMGLNIPYTHGEDKPSPTLMAKTAVAFAHSGLLFLAARTEGGPVFKELKPAAMIGYRSVDVVDVPGYRWEKSGDRFVKRRVPRRTLFEARSNSLRDPIDMTPDAAPFNVRKDESGDERSIRLACVNTGENGWFAHGEFEVVTALGQMEIITPEEIAIAAVQELRGQSTGRDVLSALDGAILGPTYKGGLVRQVALDRIQEVADQGVPSVALGDLGPPQLSKYLFELYMMRAVYESLEAAAVGLRSGNAGSRLETLLSEQPDLRDAIISVGIPILMPDGTTFLRGPEIKIPGYDPSVGPRAATPAEVDAWAAKGWVDLRADNLARWADRLDRVVASRRGGRAGASDSMSASTYGRDDFRIGEVTAWVFANEPGFRGFRIK